MTKFFLKSFLTSLLILFISYLIRTIFHTDQYLVDVGGLSAFVSGFATLSGILIAFVVFEVWNEYNKTSLLIDREAQGLERLFLLNPF